MYVRQLLVSCAGTLYDLEHHQDCSGHHMFLWPCPLASDGYGEDCGNVPGCGLRLRSVFCLALSTDSRNVELFFCSSYQLSVQKNTRRIKN